jgi:hypothetical protein
MINLLPAAEKKKLRKEYLFRLGIVVLVGIFLLEILSVVLFVPAYYALHLSTGDLSRILLEKKAQQPEGADQVGQDLAAIKKNVDLLKESGTVADVPPSVLLGEIIAQKPLGITLSLLSYTRAGAGANLQFSGNALTQDDLLAFRRNVNTNPRKPDFKYGSSFITQKSNIDFSTSIVLK